MSKDPNHYSTYYLNTAISKNNRLSVEKKVTNFWNEVFFLVFRQETVKYIIMFDEISSNVDRWVAVLVFCSITFKSIYTLIQRYILLGRGSFSFKNIEYKIKVKA